ncbi:MAG TPA: septum formation initiator family protein [Candidatus Saccharimonadales bacterium]|nr:septum formation initiator family protein [Candidatus Saccharimonadales bacterium]
MHEKIKTYQEYLEKHLERFRDVQFIGVMFFLVVLLLITWSGVKAIDANYALQKQIAGLQQQNTVQQLANNNLKLQNQYYNSSQYLELAARQDFGLAAPGETVLVVPHNVAMAHTVTLPQDQPAATTAKSGKTPAYQRNFQAWMNFFLHRPQAAN